MLVRLRRVAARAVRGVACGGAEVLVLGPAGPVVVRAARGAAKALRAGADEARKGDVGGGASWEARALWAALAAAPPTLRYVLLSVLWARVVGPRRRRRRARRAAAVQMQRNLNIAGVHRLQGLVSMLPRGDWVQDESWLEAGTGREKVDWVNSMLASLWKHISAASGSSVRDIVEPMLDDMRPPGVNSMRFKKFSLGTISPCVESVRLVPADEADEIQIQLELEWRGDPDIVFELSGPKIFGGLVPLAISLTDLDLAGSVQITLSQLMDEIPCVGGVQITMLEEPSIAYNVQVKKPASVSLSSFPGVEPVINGIISKALRKTVVYPNAVPVVLATDQPPSVVQRIERALEVKPVGKLRVQIIRCRALQKTDTFGSIDPYVAVGIGGRRTSPTLSNKDGRRRMQRTRTAKRIRNPVFEEDFELDVYSEGLEYLWIALYDHDAASKDDKVGEVCVSIASLPPNTVTHKWYPLRTPMKGQNSLSVRMVGDSMVRKSGGEVAVGLEYQPLVEQAGTSSTAERRLGPTKFGRAIARELGLATEALFSYLREDDGSLEGVPKHMIRKLASAMPVQMGIGEGLPIWAAFPGWQRSAWLNTIMLDMWPYMRHAVKDEIDELNAKVLGTLVPGFVEASIDFDLGECPPVLEAVRAYGSQMTNNDELLVEFSLKIAGDQVVGGSCGLKFNPLWRVRFEMREMQFIAIVRMRMRPLISRLPLVAGVSLSFIDQPVIDWSLVLRPSPLLPAFDLMDLPGMGALKDALTGPVLRRAGRYPSVLHVPVLDFSFPAVKELTKTDKDGLSHTIRASVIGARNLPESADPFAVLVLAGELPYEERVRHTSHKKNASSPEWNEDFKFTCGDLAYSEMVIAVFDKDRKPILSKAASPGAIARKVAPIKHLAERSQLTREQFTIDVLNIPWDQNFKDFVLSPNRKSLVHKLLAGRALVRAATLEERIRMEKDAAGHGMESEDRTDSETSAGNKLGEIKQHIASDVEQMMKNQSVLASNDLLGATIVKVDELVAEGEREAIWIPLDGGTPMPTGDGQVARPEILIEFAVETFVLGSREIVKPDADTSHATSLGRNMTLVRDLASLRSSRMTQADRVKTAVGPLTVTLESCEGMEKPPVRVPLTGRMPLRKILPRVELSVGTEVFTSEPGRGLNPSFGSQTFEFVDVDAQKDLDVAVWTPSGVGRRSLGFTSIQLADVVRLGTMNSTWKLEGVRGGRVNIKLEFHRKIVEAPPNAPAAE